MIGSTKVKGCFSRKAVNIRVYVYVCTIMFVSKESSVILKPNNNWTHICQGEVLPEDENIFPIQHAKKSRIASDHFPVKNIPLLQSALWR